MKMNEVYIPKGSEPKKIYRNLISTYYYLLFNKSEPDYYKKILKFFYKEKAKSYYDFFNNNFYVKQNILFFTLYNQLPIEFLPLPNEKYYLKYPLITFLNKRTDNKSIKLNDRFISKNLNYGLYRYYNYDDERTLNEIYNFKKGNENCMDEYQFTFNMNTVLNLPKEFFENKTLILFVNHPIICSEYKINYEARNILLVNYYIKLNSERFKISDIKNKMIKISDLKYLSIYKDMNKSDIEEVFTFKILNKDTYLYRAIKINKTINNDIYHFYTLTPFSRVFDPYYFIKDNKYILSEYVIMKDLKTLNLTTNIYFDNEIINNEYSFNKEKNIKCFDVNNIINNNKFCDYGFIDPNKKPRDSDFNRRESLFLLIWKNQYQISDKSMTYKIFLKLLSIHSYFNIMKLVKTDKNENKVLYEELYVDNTHKNDIIKNIDYTDDISKFNIRDIKEYEKIYFKPE